MNTLKELQDIWKDTEASHFAINETFKDLTNVDPKLKELRDHVESNILGFGERSFYHLFKIILNELPEKANLLEIGVFRGQTLALFRTLKPKATITGITPLDSTGGHWESDYAKDIKDLHTKFKLKQPKIIKGLSFDDDVITQAAGEYDMIYIDGGHSYEAARSDVYTYSSFVKVGGYLVVDDCANKYKIPHGMFPGIETVSRAVDELLPNEYYKEIASVVHIRVFQRIK